MQPQFGELKKILPYILPLALFLFFTSFEQTFGKSYYPIIYSFKIAAVSAYLWYLRGSFAELRRNSKGIGIGLLLGPALTAAWLIIDRFTPHLSFLGTRAAYDPFASIHNTALCWLFIVIRFFGLTAIAPIIEELFYRALLLRLVTRPDDFRKVPLGSYDTTAFVAVVILMASAHPEYLAAAFFSAAMNILLYRTKNLWSTIGAHASTNFCLGVYVLAFHSWKYW